MGFEGRGAGARPDAGKDTQGKPADAPGKPADAPGSLDASRVDQAGSMKDLTLPSPHGSGDDTVASAPLDGSIRVWTDDTAASAPLDPSIRIWTSVNDEWCYYVGGQEPLVSPTCYNTSPDGVQITGYDNGAIHVLGPTHREELIGHTDAVTSLQSLPDGRIISGSRDNTSRIWSKNVNGTWTSEGEYMGLEDIGAGARPDAGKDTQGKAADAPGSVDASRVAGAGPMETLALPNPYALGVVMLPDGRIVRSLARSDNRITPILERPDPFGARTDPFGTLSFGRTIVRNLGQDTSGAASTEIFKVPVGGFTCHQFLPDDRIAVGYGDGIIRIFTKGADSECETSAVLKGHRTEVQRITVREDGRIVSESADGTTLMWTQDTTGDWSYVKTARAGRIEYPDGSSRVVTHDGTVYMNRKDATGQERVERSDPMIEPFSVTCDTILSGRRTAVGYEDGTILICPNGAEGELDRSEVLKGHTDRVTSIQELNNGSIISGSADGNWLMWSKDATGQWTSQGM